MSNLYVVTGGPGAGKSTLLRYLRSYSFGSVEFDELPEDDGSLLGVDILSPAASSVWPAYNRLWVKIAMMMLRAGEPVMVLCPLSPSEWASRPRSSWTHLMLPGRVSTAPTWIDVPALLTGGGIPARSRKRSRMRTNSGGQ